MTTHTLLAKISTRRHFKQLENTLKNTFEDLDVVIKIVGTSGDRWVQLDISGDDEAFATNYIAKEFGFCPAKLENLQKFSVVRGYVFDLVKNAESLLVDIGVFQPSTVYAAIPLSCLQTQLTDGREISFNKIAELFGLTNDLPISVKIMTLEKVANQLDAEFSTEQIEKYSCWQESLLDRLIVVGSSLNEIKRTLKVTGLNRDVIAIEPLGAFEHALTCKFGTSATGLISRVGRYLETGKFKVFSPRKIRNLLYSPSQILKNA